MSTVEKSKTQEEADIDEIHRLFAGGMPITDPGLINRIRGRSEEARKAVFEQNGLLDIAVPFIRDLRDGVDE